MRRWVLAGALATGLWSERAGAEPVSSITQYGITWTFDAEHEAGQFVTGDYWVEGPVTLVSVTPEPTGTRHGSAVNPRGGRQPYDDRGGEFSGEDQLSLPRTLAVDESVVSSISKPEDADVKNAGALVAQAVLTVVAEPQPSGTFRPSYAGTYKRYLHESQIDWNLLPALASPGSLPDGAELLAGLDRPRIDHLSSWTIQNSCAEENWNNGPGAHACYGQQVSELISSAALYVLVSSPEREELTRSLLQHGIDNYGVLRAGGSWAPNGGHHSGRKWPIVFAATLFDDCELKRVSADYDDSYFGEDGQTYLGENGTALFGWDCGGGHGTYFEDGCTGSGAKDCRDPAGLVDACEDYRNCCTSSAWVGQMLSAHLLGARGVWGHDAYFDYVDRWMTGDVEGANGSATFVEAMWEAYRATEPARAVPTECGSDGGTAGDAGAGGEAGTASGGGSGGGGAARAGSGGATSSGGAAGTTSGRGGANGGGGTTGGATSTDGATGESGASTSGAPALTGNGTSNDDAGCGCRAVGRRSAEPSGLAWLVAALLAIRWRRNSPPGTG